MRSTQFDLGRDISKQRHFEGARYRRGNLGLQFQHISQIAVICLRPEMKAGDRIDQLRGDSEGVRGAPDAPFEHCADI